MEMLEEAMVNDNKKTICRICLNYSCEMFGGGLSLFEKYKDVYVYEKINYIASIEITEGDNLPNRICSECLLALESACNFKQQCENSDAFLHSQVSESFQELPLQSPIKEEHTDTNECDFKDENSPFPTEEQECEIFKVESEDNPYYEECNPKPFISKAIDLKLECHDCGGIFKSKCKLKVHWKKVHLPQQLICTVCKQTNKTYKSYNKHLKKKTHLNASKVHIEGFGKSRMFHCKLCDASSKRMQCIITHLVTHTGERPFACDMCNKSFSQQSGLILHKESIHNTCTKIMTCEQCGMQMKRGSKWFRHIRKHKNEKFPCSVCKKIFSLKQTLKQHMKRHSGIKSYTCEICSKSFYTASDMYNHKEKIHLKKIVYNCDECGYKTRNHGLMAKHRPKHTGDVVACDICGRFVENDQQLILHKKRHLEKNFACSYCGKFYFNKKSLNSHIKSKHNLDGPSNVAKVKIKQDLTSR